MDLYTAITVVDQMDLDPGHELDSQEARAIEELLRGAVALREIREALGIESLSEDCACCA